MTRLKPKTGDAAVLAGPNASSRPRSRFAQCIPADYKVTCFFIALFLLGQALPAWAQQLNPIPGQYHCVSEFPTANPDLPPDLRSSIDSPNGLLHTPKGDLKVLVIFAGFHGDNDPTNQDIWGNNNDSDNGWPQSDANNSWGYTLPRNYADFGYTDNIEFAPHNLDRSVSNYLYKMSKGQFRVTFGYFPRRVNVYINPNPSKHNWGDYTKDVLERVGTEGGASTFNWEEFDQRKNNNINSSPFLVNNMNSSPDGVLDYVVVVWRNTRNSPNVRPITYDNLGEGGHAWTGLPSTKITVKKSPTVTEEYTANHGHVEVGQLGGYSFGGFMHEFAHNIFRAPHYNNANGAKGHYYYNNYGWGMMSGQVNQSANAWERWYNGWIELETGSNQVNSDIRSVDDLEATSGEFTLRDFVKYGDVVRIKIPYTNQHLWLENHTGATPFDDRNGLDVGGGGVPFKDPPRGILAFVESIGSRSTAVEVKNHAHANGIKVVSGDGNYDYTPLPTPLDNYNEHYTKTPHFDFTRTPNPSGGQNEVTGVLINRDNNPSVLNYAYFYANGDPNPGFEQDDLVRLDSDFADGFLGPNIGFNTVGQKMGLSHNPMIIPHQTFDIPANKLSPINLHGLSVEIKSIDPATGDITIKVRFDDTNITQSTRWTGELIMENMNVNVLARNTLTINKSGTANRTTLLNNAFVNPTILTCKAGSKLEVDGSATVVIEDETTFKMEAGSEVIIRPGATFIVRNNSVLDIADDAVFTVMEGGTLIVEEGSEVITRNNKAGKGLNAPNFSIVRVKDNSKVIVESGAVFELQNSSAGYGLILEGSQSELNVKGLLKTINGVNLTFGGFGFISFERTSSVNLAPNSRVIQSGSDNNDILYVIKDLANLFLTPYDVNISNGKIKHGYSAAFTISGTTNDVIFNNVKFEGDNNPLLGSTGLSCVNVPTLTMSNCNITGFYMEGLVLDNVASATLTNTTISQTGNSGIRSNFKNTNLYLSGCTISGSNNGIFYNGITTTPKITNLYLRNKTVVSNNGYGISAAAPAGSRLNVVAGDQGCAWIINNSLGGIKGTDIYLDIDALTHKGSNCPKQTNRFDGNTINGGYIFDICYSSTIQNNTISARGNYWGGTIAYNLRIGTCTGLGQQPVPVTLNSTNPVTCMPVACDGCAGDPVCIPGGGGGASRMASAGTQSSDNVEEFSINVYPNPASDNIFLEIQDNGLAGSYNYKVINSIGIVVLEGKLKEKENRINIQNLAKGTYTVSVFKDDKTIRSSKLVTVK